MPLRARLHLLHRAVILFLVAGMLLSFRLWTHDRSFPALPLIGETPFLAFPFDYIFTGLLFVVLVVAFFNWKKYLGWTIIGMLVLAALDDQNRLQAWVYVYMLFLGAFVVARDDDSAVRYLRVIVTGMYAWTGIHKANAAFINGIFKDILTELFGITNPETISALSAAGYLIPAIEIAIALLLFFPRTRTAGCWLALATHVFILVYLGPLARNSNSVVYPWNFAMCACVFLLFYKTSDPVLNVNRLLPDFRLLFFIALAWIAPVLNFFGAWDHYLSFSYYSGKANAFYVGLSDEACTYVDARAHRYFVKPPGATGGVFLDVNAWSVGELNVPFYPQSHAFDKLRGAFCRLCIPPGEVYFFEVLSGGKQDYVKKACGDE